MVELSVANVNGIAVVDFQENEILDIEKSRAIALKLAEIVDRGAVSNLLIDFRFVKLITSSMIDELLQLRKKCTVSQVRLIFCNLSNDLTDVMKKLKLDKIFEIYESREQAVMAFATVKT